MQEYCKNAKKGIKVDNLISKADDRVADGTNRTQRRDKTQRQAG
jgi:hypothetical protein